MTLQITPSHFHPLYRPSTCELRLYLMQKGIEPAPPSEFEQVIFRLGQRHEKYHFSTFPEVSELSGKSSTKALEEIRKGRSVIYKGELCAQVSLDGQTIDIVGYSGLYDQRRISLFYPGLQDCSQCN